LLKFIVYWLLTAYWSLEFDNFILYFIKRSSYFYHKSEFKPIFTKLIREERFFSTRLSKHKLTAYAQNCRSEWPEKCMKLIFWFQYVRPHTLHKGMLSTMRENYCNTALNSTGVNSARDLRLDVT